MREYVSSPLFTYFSIGLEVCRSIELQYNTIEEQVPLRTQIGVIGEEVRVAGLRI